MALSYRYVARYVADATAPTTPDYVASRRRAGFTREASWLQSTPMGDVAVVYIEADDLDATLNALGTSDHP